MQIERVPSVLDIGDFSEESFDIPENCLNIMGSK
jgi:hypothetical protein